MTKEEKIELINEVTAMPAVWMDEHHQYEANPKGQKMIREFLWKLINEDAQEAYNRAINPVAFM